MMPRTTRRAVVLFMAVWLSLATAGAAQHQSTGWSSPERISDDVLAYNYPHVVADPYGCIHAIWLANSLPADKDTYDSVFYTVHCGTTWSDPVDVLAVPFGSDLMLEGMVADRRGNLFILWRTDGELRLSRATVRSAASPRSWFTVNVLPGTRVTDAALAARSDDALHLLLIAQNAEILHLAIDPQGMFGPVTVVAEASSSDAAFARPALAVDDSRVYALWNIHERWNDWSPTGLWFARSTDGGQTWESPQVLASGAGNGKCTIALDRDGWVHVLWAGTLQLGGRYHRFSSDHGLQWSDTVVVAQDLTGNAGGSSIADSDGILHWVFGGLGYDGEGVRYSRWINGSWLPHVRIDANLPHGEAASLAIVRGHILHAIWPDLAQQVIYHAWYDTGSRPIDPEPFLLETDNLSASATVTPAPEDTPQATPSPLALPQQQVTDPKIVLVFGYMIVPPLAITVAAVALVRLSHRRHRD